MAKKTQQRSDEHTRFRTIAPAAALIGLTLLAYLPAMRAGFIWDDPDYVTQNATLRSLSGLAQIWFVPRSIPQYYPMVHTTFWIEFHLWQLWSPGYHIVNILLHAGSALLLFALLRKMAFPAAWLAAAVFALHPVHVESVAWVTERKNVLSGFFYLLAMLAYFRFQHPSAEHSAKNRRAYGSALGLFVLALLSKTVTCSLPAAILLVLWWKRGRLRWADTIPLIPFFAIGLAAALTTAWLEKQHVGASGAEFDFSPIERILIAGRAVWFYFWKLIAPVDLAFIYPRWNIDPTRRWQLLFPVAAVLMLLALFFLRRRIGRGPLVALLFFGGTLLPALGFVNVYPMRYSFVADHFQYLASVGPIVLIVALLRRLAQRTTPYIPVVLIPLGLITFQQAKIYQSTETLWTDTVEKNPDSWMVRTNLGHALVERGAYDDAQEQYELALKLAPHLPEPHWNVGIGLSVRGDYDGALRHFNQALRLDPNFPQAYFSRGNIYRERGRLDAAAAEYQKAVALKPDYAEAYLNLGVIAEAQNQPDDAIRYYELAVRNKLDYAIGHNNLANVLRASGRPQEALIHYSQVLRLQPRRADVHANMGATFLQLRQVDNAIAAFRTALAIDPNLEPARRGLEYALRLRGQ
ncbi:MAG TPA: tetratricopeptide repeat protein [Tepidisphaeraceae bacterium]|nr:tetratricopeptide repeat protein [Tepidisphaeraceae bacterium]